MALHATFLRTNFVKGAHLDKVYSMVYQTLLVKHVLGQKIKDGKFQKSNTKILLIHNHITSDSNMKRPFYKGYEKSGNSAAKKLDVLLWPISAMAWCDGGRLNGEITNTTTARSFLYSPVNAVQIQKQNWWEKALTISAISFERERIVVFPRSTNRGSCLGV